MRMYVNQQPLDEDTNAKDSYRFLAGGIRG